MQRVVPENCGFVSLLRQGPSNLLGHRPIAHAQAVGRCEPADGLVPISLVRKASESDARHSSSRRLMLESAAFIQPRDERSRHLDSRPPHFSGLRSWPMPPAAFGGGDPGGVLFILLTTCHALLLYLQLSGCGINLLRKVRPFIGRFLKASMVGFTLLSAVSRSYYFTNTICA